MVIEVNATDTFTGWLESLRDRKAASIILRRIRQLRMGLFGDVKPVGEGVSELRVDFGPGYLASEL